MSAFHSVTAAREETERKGKEHELLTQDDLAKFGKTLATVRDQVQHRIDMEESLVIKDRNSWDVV